MNDPQKIKGPVDINVYYVTLPPKSQLKKNCICMKRGKCVFFFGLRGKELLTPLIPFLKVMLSNRWACTTELRLTLEK